MRQNRSGPARLAIAAGLLLLGAASPGRSLAATPDELDAVRRETVAAAREARSHEQTLAGLQHQIELIDRDAEARRRGLEESRPEQEQLLGALEFLARNPPDPATDSERVASPLDRARGELLLDVAIPGLRQQARALRGEFARIAALRRDIAPRQAAADSESRAIADARERIARLVTRRRELAQALLPADDGADARLTRLGREAKDPADLIRRADAATDRRDRELVSRARANAAKADAAAITEDTADPTRPRGLRPFDPPQSALLPPVSGTISQPLDGEGADSAKDALNLVAPAAAEVVAPFDGRVVYAGPFRDLGLVLIIRHGRGYHSLLSGLDRVDIEIDRWVVAGEPVGAMPEGSGRPLHFELRRDGRPVDPQPWLATSDAERPGEVPRGLDDRNGEQRVRQ